MMKKSAFELANPDASPAELIDDRIRELGGWRGATLAKLRGLIKDAVPGVIEAWKWNVPVWEHNGIVCTGEAYKAAVKLTFPKGAKVPDPKRIFNASLEGNARRAIDFAEGAKLDEKGLKALFQAAAALNAPKKKGK